MSPSHYKVNLEACQNDLFVLWGCVRATRSLHDEVTGI